MSNLWGLWLNTHGWNPKELPWLCAVTTTTSHWKPNDRNYLTGWKRKIKGLQKSQTQLNRRKRPTKWWINLLLLLLPQYRNLQSRKLFGYNHLQNHQISSTIFCKNFIKYGNALRSSKKREENEETVQEIVSTAFCRILECAWQIYHSEFTHGQPYDRFQKTAYIPVPWSSHHWNIKRDLSS